MKNYKKLLLLKIYLWLAIIIICWLIFNRVANLYHDLASFSGQNLYTWLNRSSGRDYVVNAKNFKITWHKFSLQLNISDLIITAKQQEHNSSKIAVNYVSFGSITGKINILASILTGKIAIKDLMLEDLRVRLNNLEPAHQIKVIFGNLLLRIDHFRSAEKRFTLLAKFSLEQMDCNLELLLTFADQKLQLSKLSFTHNAEHVREVFKYLPSSLINSEILTWLHEALLAGSIKSSYIVWDAKDYLLWRVKFQDLKLCYAKNWPVIEGLNANLELINDKLKIDMEPKLGNALILKQPINQLTADLVKPDPLQPGLLLLINGEIVTSVHTILQFVDQTFKLHSLEKIFKNQSFNEGVVLSLNFNIPIDVDGKIKENFFQIIGNCKLKNNLSVDFKVAWNERFLIIESAGLYLKILLTSIENSLHDGLTNNGLLKKIYIVEGRILEQDLNAVTLKYNTELNKFTIDGEQAKGEISYDLTGNTGLTIDLEKLTIILNKEKLINLQNLFNNLNLITKLNFNCEHIYINNRDIGNINFIVDNNLKNPDAPMDLLATIPIAFNNELMNLDANMQILSNDGINSNIALNGKLYSNNFGNLLKYFDLDKNKDFLKKGVGLVNFTVNLNDLHLPKTNILDLDLADLTGELELDLSNGVILGVDPGISKIIGLFSLEYLQKRLHLDFSDVTEQGFVFDLCKGRISLQPGHMVFNDLMIHGPAAKIKIIGNIALIHKSLDLIVEVTNKVGATLPLAAAIAAGNPIVGAAIWLFDHASGAKVSEFKSTKYKVTGTWEQPIIETVAL